MLFRSVGHPAQPVVVVGRRNLGDRGRDAERADLIGHAAKVAEETLKAVRKGKHEIVLSFVGKLLVWGTRRNPWLLDHCVAKWG